MSCGPVQGTQAMHSSSNSASCIPKTYITIFLKQTYKKDKELRKSLKREHRQVFCACSVKRQQSDKFELILNWKERVKCSLLPVEQKENNIVKFLGFLGWP